VRENLAHQVEEALVVLNLTRVRFSSNEMEKLFFLLNLMVKVLFDVMTMKAAASRVPLHEWNRNKQH
jgi:hypothetical protein